MFTLNNIFYYYVLSVWLMELIRNFEIVLFNILKVYRIHCGYYLYKLICKIILLAVAIYHNLMMVLNTLQYLFLVQ